MPEKMMELNVLLYIMTAAGAAGAVGMLAVHLAYRRAMRKTKKAASLKEKWLNLWKTRDRLLNRMNLLVWGPALLSSACLVLALYLNTRLDMKNGLPLSYLYVGTAVPVILLILRQALDFSYREELVMNSLADYILQTGIRNEHKAETPAAREAAVEQSGPAGKTDRHFRRKKGFPGQTGSISSGKEAVRQERIRAEMTAAAERGRSNSGMAAESTGYSPEEQALREEAVERITASIRQTAATGSHFSKMLKPEEEEILREIIREFMD